MIPNFAFDNMTNRDAFWAAKIVMSFTDEQIRALVETGEFSISRDREYLIQVITERRDKIGEYWFRQINPLDNLVLQKVNDNYILSFDNLYTKYGFAKDQGEISYKIEYLNVQDKKISDPTIVTEPSVVIPQSFLNNLPSTIRIRTLGKEKNWKKYVSVEINKDFEIVGITREN
jgi:hypothetical protein